MADSEASLVVRISGDIKSFQDALEQAKSKTEAFSESLKGIGEVAAIGFAAVTAEIGLSIEKYGEHETATRELNLAIENQGLSVDELSQKYQEQASTLATLTGIDSDRIVQGQAVFQSLVGQVEITDEMSKAATDLSIRTGSVTSAFELMARGVQGNARVLKQFGIVIDENVPKSERLAQIVAAIEQKMGGQAAAANQGVGSIKGLTTSFIELEKAIGEQFAPIFTEVVQKMTEFINTIKENQGLVELAAGFLAAAAGLTAIVGAIAAAGIAFTALNAMVVTLGISLAAATGGLTIIAGLLVAAGVAAAAYASKTLAAKDPVAQLESQIDSLQKKLEKTNAELAVATPGTGLFRRLTEEAKQTQDQIEIMNKKLEKAQQLEMQRSQASGADPEKLAAAKAAAAESDRMDALRIQKKKETVALGKLIDQDESDELIALKKKEIQTIAQLETEQDSEIRSQLQKRLATEKQDYEDANNAVVSQRKEFNEQILAQNKEYQAMDAEDKRIFLANNKKELMKSMLDEDMAVQQNAKTRAQIQIKANNQFLLDQAKFGKAYALINKMMHDEILTGSKQAFGDLAQMQSSSSATLKSIGKTAAIANVMISTAESAMRIFDGFSTIPIIGPALGVAGAAAAIAFGAEKVSAINAAAEGALVTGGIPGKDSVPFMLTPGELVVPKPNFNEVVGAVAAQRSSENSEMNMEGGVGEQISVELSLKDNLVEFVESKIVERRRLKRSLI